MALACRIMGSYYSMPAPDRKRGLHLSLRQQMNELRPAMDAALASSAEALTLLQNGDGYWCAELTADSTLESDYVLLQLWLHPPVDGLWSPPSRGRIEKACKAVLDRQLADGGWNIYPQGPAEVNATVRAYTALKLEGHSPTAPYMAKARERAWHWADCKRATAIPRSISACLICSRKSSRRACLRKS